MFRTDSENNIYATRGDVVSLLITANNGETSFTLPAGTVIRLKVFQKKNCANVMMSKDVTVDTETAQVAMTLSEDDTRIGEVISKPVDYWYEVEMNPDTASQTIIGYDEDGAKLFRLYPEGGGDE